MRSTTFASSSTEDPEEVLRKHVSQDLGDNTPMADKNWAHSLYMKTTTPEAIERFLNRSGDYKNGRWVGIPQAPSTAIALRQPLCGLINAILGCLASGTAGTRTAVNSRVNRFEGPTIEGTKHCCTPDIVVKASGPSFSLPKSSQLGFSNVATCFDVKLDEEADSYTHHLPYHAAYAKHIFALQPNRMFVRTLVLTENQACLFHFDRSGAQYSPVFNIHDEPATFIRLILGLCSSDERTLGFDDTIQWEVEAHGSKRGRTLRTVAGDGTITTYQLATSAAPFTRENVRGRGTTCWSAKDSEGNSLIVKDYWILDGQETEAKLLEEAKGLRGICQMVSYEENRFQTKDLRGNVQELESGSFRNRKLTRIVMKAYGPSIEKFTSVAQLLAALRDAIAAHKLLFLKDIIHRDISPGNILLGKAGAEEGIRGILIDLDIAFKCGVLGPDRAAHVNGTRVFQSLTVLRTCELEPCDVSAHDYLDDLESFFWVLSYLLITYNADGTRATRTNLHKYLDSWNASPDRAASAKFRFFFQAMTGAEVLVKMDQGWRHACGDLFTNFRQYMRDISEQKDDLAFARGRIRKEGTFPNRFSSLLEDVDKHYDYVLGLFDEALKKASGNVQSEARLTSATTPPLATQPPSISPVQPSSKPFLPQTPADCVPPTPPSQPSQSSASTQSSLITPSASSGQPGPSLAVSSSQPRPLKRRCQDAELEDSCIEVKRECPPTRQPLSRMVVEQSLNKS
ncbi:hypothetical protein MD484_g3714, partial [Candolleomyces efflorescens]